MKEISVEQLKNKLVNTNTIVEETLELHPESPEESRKNLKNLMGSVESLNDALFFKLEKLRSKIQGYNIQRYSDVEAQMNQFMETIQIPPLDDSILLLEENRNILELKAIQRYLKYYIEIEKNAKHVMSSLMESALDEDYRFLSELICYGIKYGDLDNRSVYFEFGKQLEEKMLRQFKEGLETDELTVCKQAFETLKNIFKETVLIDGYLNDLFSKEAAKHANPNLITQINIDNFVLENSEFQQCIDTAITILGPSLPKYIAIFDDSPSYKGYLYRKIYENYLSKNIASFLDITDSALFLLSLVDVHAQLQKYQEFLATCTPKAFLDEYAAEGVGIYIPIAVTKEKQMFDEVFGILFYGTETVNSYIIMGEKARETTDYIAMYKKLLCLVYGMENRCEKVYRTAETDEIIAYFYKKMKVLIEKISVGEPLAVIEKLSKMYLLTKRYFGKRIQLVKEWVGMLDTRIREAYENKISACNSMIQSKIGSMYFTSKNSHKTVLEMIKRCVEEGKALTGRNHELYVYRILSLAYNGIYKQILSIIYSKEQRDHLMDGIGDFLGYATILDNVDLVRKFFHLKEIGTLITVEIDFLRNVFENYQGSITDGEVAAILKCRKDRDSAKEILGKR